MMTLREEIELKEKELNELRKQERIEQEEALRKANAERDNDLLLIMNSIKKFNKKHNEHIYLSTNNNAEIGNVIYKFLFPWTE